MSLSPFQKKVAETRFAEHQRKEQNKHGFEEKFMSKVWWIGMIGGALFVLCRLLAGYLNIAAAIGLIAWGCSAFIYFGLWKVPVLIFERGFEDSWRESLHSIQSYSRGNKTLALLGVVPLGAAIVVLFS